MYRRAGRRGWYAFLDWEHKDISLGGTDDEEEAKAAFAELLKERRGILELASGETSLSAIFDMCRERAQTNHTPKTVYELHLNLSRVLTWLEGRGIASPRKVDKPLVEDYKTSRRFDGVSASRINRELDSWKKAMKLAVEQRCAQPRVLEKDVVFVKLREPRPEPHQAGLTRAHLERFFEHAGDAGYRALFRVVLGTAMRDEEVRHMAEGDLRKGAIVVTPKPPGACECCPDGWSTKGFRYRTIPVTKETLAAARQFLKAKGALNLDKKKVWKKLQAFRAAANKPTGKRRVRDPIPHFSLHDLRRAWASHMLDAGHKIQKISEWLGHADVLTTMRYLRVIDNELPKPETLPW
jgi:integrase